MKKLKHITKICQEIYEEKGSAAVYDHVNEQLQKNNGAYREVKYQLCSGCNAKTPQWHNECLICGTSN